MNAFALLIPMKPWHRAKSRLAADGIAPDLARAFALDTIAAALACPVVAEVHVITDQADFSVPGVGVLADRGAGDLNAALRAGAADLRQDRPDLAVAAMCADLPTLRADDLSAALTMAATEAPRWYVADAAGTGTTLLTARTGDLDPRFGPDSARRHASSGAVALPLAVPTLRRDVDTLEDLEDARALGLGEHTRTVVVPH